MDPIGIFRNSSVDIWYSSCTRDTKRGKTDYFIANDQRRPGVASTHSLTELREGADICVRYKGSEAAKFQLRSAHLVGNDRCLEILKMEGSLAKVLRVSPAGHCGKCFWARKRCRNGSKGSLGVWNDGRCGLNEGNVIETALEVVEFVLEDECGLVINAALIEDVRSGANSECTGPVDFQTGSGSQHPATRDDYSATEVTVLNCLQGCNEQKFTGSGV